jgi:hypothetical protein
MAVGRRVYTGDVPNPSPAPSPSPAGKNIGSVPKVVGKNIATVPKAAVAPVTGYSGGGGGGGGGGGLDLSTLAPSPEDYLAGDSTYQAQQAALQRALEAYQADNTRQSTSYNTDYQNGLAQLGYRPGAAQDDPSTPNVDESQGQWAQGDQTTAYGRSYQNQLNDFAGRGLLRSTFYNNALDDTNRQFNDQLASVNKGKTDFMDQLAQSLASYQNENQLSQQQARADAIARRAAGYSSAPAAV